MWEEESLSKVIGISIVSLFLISIPLLLTSYGLLLNLFKPWFLAAGQERFRTLTSSYYRGAQGIILVYDVTRRETFDNLSDVWAKEVELYSTNKDCVKMLIGNKVDRESERAVSREEGIALAKELGSFFLECSAKTRENVEKCFEELALKIMEAPSLIEEGSTVVKRNILKQQEFQPASTASCCL